MSLDQQNELPSSQNKFTIGSDHFSSQSDVAFAILLNSISGLTPLDIPKATWARPLLAMNHLNPQSVLPRGACGPRALWLPCVRLITAPLSHLVPIPPWKLASGS